MTREEQIIQACESLSGDEQGSFLAGAEWADKNPTDFNWQKIFFEGHEHKVCLTVLRRYHEVIEALEFYANKKYNWFSGGMEGDGASYSGEMGDKAREVLAKIQSGFSKEDER